MTQSSKVAAIQLTSSNSVEENLSTVEYYLQAAQAQKVQLLVLPENFAFMGSTPQDKLSIAEYYGKGPIQSHLSQWAQQYKLWIIAGSIPLKSNQKNRVRSSCLVYKDNGYCVACYDKIHLFDVCVSDQEEYRESATIERGKGDINVVETPVGPVGLSICYDVRFPELYRQLVQRGAELLTVPSAFTAVTGEAHWESLLRARAIENLCYVIAPNQGGTHADGRQTYGHSMIIDPWGRILAKHKQGAGMITAEIDLNYLYQLRRQFPCNDHHVL